ncbi:thioesterase II family protein [Actinomadura macra]|uniref:thioesterase II family protein n=1 Tax=Actinomadura macra TaxID=46164 RepID=UPI000830A6D3|nr:alpha/beta fold hydrolase [Actinomadura macra]
MTLPSTDTEAWIRTYHQGPDGRLRLLCFPHAGGSASFFFPVSAQLAPDVDVRAVQYPGRQDRRAEPNIDNVPDLADAIRDAVLPLAEGPLAFFGHSMGAVLAYEVALRLEEAGAPPLARLFVSGRRAPSRHRETTVHQRDDRGVVEELRHLSGTRSDLLSDPETLEMILPAVRNDYRAIETYRPAPGRTLTCPIAAYVGDSDPQVTIDEAGAWAGHTSGAFELRVFRGGHFYLTDHAGDVVRVLSDDLAGLPGR